jgi:TonB family protein
MVRRHAVIALLTAVAMGTAASAQQGFMPASFQGGSVPQLNVLSIEAGGGQVLLEITVSRDGSVIDSRPLRVTPSFTERIQSTSSGWRFTPAEALLDPRDQRPGGPLTRPIESKVLVAGIFRPPTLLGPSIGEAISEVSNPSDEIPFPLSVIQPLYPPNARDAGVVLVEARVNPQGAVIGAVVKISSPGFDSAALDAARQWRFRPARVGGLFVPSLAYIVFGFPMPLTFGTSPGAPTPGN